MKNKILFLALNVFLLTFIGCKGDKDIDSLDLVKPEKENTFFKATIKVIVKKDDNFAFFYTKDGSTDFKLEPIWQAVKGSESEQEITYNLPNILPTQLRFDFGLKPDQDDIILKSIVLEYKDKKREIAGAELANFFRADLNKCTFEAGSGVIKAIVVNGVKQSPSLYPQEAYLGPELKKLGM
jgi:hypothetical protein